MNKVKNFFSKSYVWLIMLFFYLPIFYVMLFSFNESKSLTRFTGFSLQWYKKMFETRTIREAIYYTIIIAVLATIISTIIGTLTAIGLSKSKKVLREVVLQVNDLPMMNPDIVTAIGFMLLFTSLSIEKGFGTILLAHIVFCIPYVILTVMPRLRQLDDNLAEAALDLGATPVQALWKVVVPEIIPGVLSGFLLCITLSLDDYIITAFTRDNSFQTLSTFVEGVTAKGSLPSDLRALTTLIFIIMLGVLFIINWRTKDKREEKNK